MNIFLRVKSYKQRSFGILRLLTANILLVDFKIDY